MTISRKGVRWAPRHHSRVKTFHLLPSQCMPENPVLHLQM
ncbi:hypothetical protein T11_18097 [Trichinella zimbabwensis]|uniref:Uncharacterized protein n=1 Tax=Trichinella zimbabwensis TaxID=268475 RepID=A0A0V1G7C5_9BILA|nr:hypothetical protein T11_18097 [Trichinella zimbabwensis]